MASILLLLACFGFAIRPGDARAGITDAVKATTLPNGLRVLVLENHKAPVATFAVFYRVGSRNEQIGKTGLSHLIEHLMFRGTKKLKPEEFSNIIQQNGGMDNAFTTDDFTGYFEVINKDHLDVPIRLEADRMGSFEPKGFDSEKAVVIEERRLRTEDNPEDALFEAARAQAFVQHPYHWPVIGWMHDIQNLTLDDALAYQRIYYSPQNAIVLAVGDFNADKVTKDIAENFGSLKNGPKAPPVSEIEPPQVGQRQLMVKHAADLPAFVQCYHAPNYQSADGFPLELAAVVLAGGKSSRLYKKMVVEKQMVIDVDASYDRLSFDPDQFCISAQLRPGFKAEDALEIVNSEIKGLQDKPLEDIELQKAKNQEQASFVYGQDSIFRQAMALAQYEMLSGYKTLDEFLAGIGKVSAEDIQRATKQHLTEDNQTVGILIPTGTLPHRGGGEAGKMVHHVNITAGDLP